MVSPSVLSTLDAAAKLLGNDSRTAESLRMTRGHVADVRAGRRHLTLDQIASLAQIVNVDGPTLLADNELRRIKDDAHRERLRRALFMLGLAGVALLTTLLPDCAMGSVNNAQAARVDLLYIVRTAIRSAVKRAAHSIRDLRLKSVCDLPTIPDMLRHQGRCAPLRDPCGLLDPFRVTGLL